MVFVAPKVVTIDFAGLLLDVLGFTDDEFVSVIHWFPGDDTPHTAVMKPSEAPAYIDGLPDTVNVFFGVNLTRGPARRGKGRGGSKDVTRLACLVCDLDFKIDGGCGSRDVALGIAAEVGLLLGTRASVVVESGHGLHAYWPVDDGHVVGEDISKVQALSRRFGRLVDHMAYANHKVSVDKVSDLARVLRVPGTLNNKGSS